MVSQLTSIVKNTDDSRLYRAVSFINDNSTMEVGLTAEGQPAVRSDIVAYHFKRSHKNVLRDIAKLRAKCPESFFALNFEPKEIEVKTGFGVRKDRAYLLTRDAFSLLVMGFTGAEAVRWKIRYIEAFNALEAAVRESRAEAAREAGYRQGREEGQMARQEAARLVWQLGPAQKRRLRAAVRYRRLGLGREALARLLRCHSREVHSLLKAARVLGWLEDAPTPPAPVQASLLEEVRHAR